MSDLLTFTEEQVLLPDANQQVSSSIFDTSGFDRKFVTLAGTDTMVVLRQGIDPGILGYLQKIGALPNSIQQMIVNGHTSSTHASLLADPSRTAEISERGGKFIHPYMQTEATDLVAYRANKETPNETQVVNFLSDKATLYRIFPAEMLPRIYSERDLLHISPDTTLVTKPRENASCIDIFKFNVDAYRKLKTSGLRFEDALIQEYVKSDGAYSVIYQRQGDKVVPVYMSEQVIIENPDGSFDYDAGRITPDLMEEIDEELRMIDEIIQRNPIFQDLHIFNVDFLKRKDSRIPAVMEINPRFPSSVAIAGLLSRLELSRSNLFMHNSNFPNPFNSSQEFIERLEACSLLFDPQTETREGIIPINFNSLQRGGYTVDAVIVARSEDEYLKYLNFLESLNNA